MSTTWVEISCQVPSELADMVSEFLTTLSGSGVCIENRHVDAFSPGEIPEMPTVCIRSYFPSGADREEAVIAIQEFLESLAREFPGTVIPSPEVTTVADEDWSTSWKANFKPLRIGRRLLIIPSWEEAHICDDDIVLRIDPGMAFGTGGHETTRLCLELLESIMDSAPLMGSPSVLDLGTGSGILAMAAVQLGAGRVCAVDIDPLAVEVARENLGLNGLLDQVECSTTPLESLTGSFDIILANILAEELVRLAVPICDRLLPGGHLILSGILAEKEQLVQCGFSDRPVTFQGVRSEGEWVALHYRKEEQA